MSCFKKQHRQTMELGPRISLLALLLLLTVSASYAKCLRRTPIGGKCQLTAFCKLPGVCDSGTKQCRIPVGKKCQQNDDCVLGYICDGDSCRRNVGEQCEVDSDCVTRPGVKCISGICRCGDVYTSEGNIASPNYPNDYLKNLSCTWIIRAPAEYVIKIQSTDFAIVESTDCEDMLTIIDGETPGDQELFLSCGFNVPNILQSTGSVVRVQFITDDSSQHRGFNLVFSFVSPGNP